MKLVYLMDDYFTSYEIANIPDKWFDYTHIAIMKDNCWQVLILYFNALEQTKQAELKQVAFISGADASIEVLSQDDLKETYGITQFTFEDNIKQDDICILMH